MMETNEKLPLAVGNRRDTQRQETGDDVGLWHRYVGIHLRGDVRQQERAKNRRHRHCWRRWKDHGRVRTGTGMMEVTIKGESETIKTKTRKRMKKRTGKFICTLASGMQWRRRHQSLQTKYKAIIGAHVMTLGVGKPRTLALPNSPNGNVIACGKRGGERIGIRAKSD